MPDQEKELRAIRDALEEVRGQIDRALTRATAPPAKEIRSLGWRCTACGHIKHFTRPMPIHVARPCPKCRGAEFEAV